MTGCQWARANRQCNAMTISYSGNFCRLLVRWKGSIWKACWLELVVFLALYYLMRAIYNILLPVLDPEENYHYRRSFEQLSLMFDEYTKQIPLTFLLGFYISSIVTRWWNQFEYVAWPDDLLSLLCALMPGTDNKSRMRRHTIARYVNLTSVLAWRDISSKLRRRFPTIAHIVATGLMTEEEHKIYESIEVETVRWFVPLHWAQKIVVQEIQDEKPLPSLVSQFVQDLKLYRLSFRKLYCYDWVCIPLVYTQVAALATYGYFAFCLIGRQFLDPAKKYKCCEVDFVVPIFTIVQFLFFVGWFKVGQDLMRPFGTDDDDIELNYIFDRNMQSSFAIVNAVEMQAPTLTEDTFWAYQDRLVPPLAHTKMSAKLKEHPPKLHSYVVMNKEEDGEIAEPSEEEKCRFITREKRKSHIHW